MNTNVLHDHHHHDDPSSKVIFGFWIFIMSDCLLFAILFATYAVLRNNTFGGIGITQVANLSSVLQQTLLLLASTFTYALSSLAMHKGSRNATLFWWLITFLLGVAFIGMEVHQLAYLIETGSSWQTSAFLSAYFTLVGVHGAHLVVGLLWIIVLMIQLMIKNITPTMKTRLTCLGLFWTFLNIIWIFIFTIVYLMGAI